MIEKHEDKAGEQGMHEIRKENLPQKTFCAKERIAPNISSISAQMGGELISQGMAADYPTIVAMNRRIGELFHMVTCYNRELDEISEEHLKGLREKKKQVMIRR